MTLRGALIGYGFISGKGHVPAYLERKKGSNDVEIVAVADICEGRRALIKQALPEARVYASANELFAAEKGQLDFVDISTPPCDHAALAVQALDQGLHVLCEKPLATTNAEALRMLRAAQKNKRVLFPAHNYKHAPVVKAIREIIQSGRIGQVSSITLSTFRNTHAKGVTEWDTHWRRNKAKSGGGIAMDHGSHSFYLTFEWMNAMPTAVTAKMSNLQADTYDTEDQFAGLLTFPTGLAQIHLSWTAGVRKVIYTLQGTRGAITVDDDDMQIATMKNTGGEDVGKGAVDWDFEKREIKSNWMDASHVSWFNSLFDSFKLAIQNAEYVGKEAKEALMCVNIITTAYQSAGQSCRELPLASPEELLKATLGEDLGKGASARDLG